ncbi:WD repeat-containing protein 86 isoform X2 [Heterocephalus glaber]|uniref:WD repeat-containing protein 86 isoform X2 n=1 Tax=Heterocephalus glaber TaxID=10181 RepID=A0AAX6RID4_HETGA|nr:WD repeat-containing protein 86 isoform X2 [Heterocephalus glaber]
MGGGGSALRVCSDHRGGINWLSLSPDGQRLLTGSEDGTARLWSTANGQCCALLQGHESYVTFCQLEDGAAFTCSADCTIRRWDLHTGQCVQVYQGHTSIVNRILVANNQLFSSSYDRTARVWSVDKGQVSREFRGHRNCVLTLAYSAPWDAPCVEEAEARGLLVTGSTDGTAKVWQVASGCCHQTLRGHTGAVLCLVLDELGRTAFTGSTDATIRAWDILSGEQLRVFREHQGSIICLELVEQLLYSGSADRTVKCWLADAGQCVRTFPAHRRSVSALKFHAGTSKICNGEGQRSLQRPLSSSQCSQAAEMPVPGHLMPSRERCRECSGAMRLSSTACRCTAMCCTQPRTTVRCASGICVGSRPPAPGPQASAACHASSATGWPASRLCPCSPPELEDTSLSGNQRAGTRPWARAASFPKPPGIHLLPIPSPAPWSTLGAPKLLKAPGESLYAESGKGDFFTKATEPDCCLGKLSPKSSCRTQIHVFEVNSALGYVCSVNQILAPFVDRGQLCLLAETRGCHQCHRRQWLWKRPGSEELALGSLLWRFSRGLTLLGLHKSMAGPHCARHGGTHRASAAQVSCQEELQGRGQEPPQHP